MKKARLGEDAAAPVAPRFRNVIVEIGEVHDLTGIYIIEGDAEGRDAFEALMVEAKELGDAKSTPVGCFLSLLSGVESYGGGKRAANLNQRLCELVAKYNLTCTGNEFLAAEAQGWTRGVSSFMMVSGFY